jgi:hypothetical protein
MMILFMAPVMEAREEVSKTIPYYKLCIYTSVLARGLCQLSSSFWPSSEAPPEVTQYQSPGTAPRSVAEQLPKRAVFR